MIPLNGPLARLLGAVGLATCLVAGGPASACEAGFSGTPEVESFVAAMAERHGFDAEALHRDFAAVSPNDAVLKAIVPAAVPELRRSWPRYRARFINARRIAEGTRFRDAHRETLARAEAEYGVPADIIVAIIGVETEYGRNMGRFPVLEALSTLAFCYPPRAEFFRGELEQFLLLSRENSLPPLAVLGSYAGAIGIPQFMPGSQRRFAVDFDGDGRVDLSDSAADAIGSVGSFLAAHGWHPGEQVAARAALAHGEPPSPPAVLARPATPIAEFAARGIVTRARVPPETPAMLVVLDGPKTAPEYWLGFDNLYALTRYNRSSFYAMAVFELSRAIGGADVGLSVRKGYRRKHRRGG